MEKGKIELKYRDFFRTEFEEEKKLKKAVILSAGIGRRLKPLSDNLPKSLLKVAGREILYRNIKNLMDIGIEEFIIVTNPRYVDKISEFIDRYNINAKIVINEHPERENGYSVYILKDYIDDEEEFILLMGDHIYERGFFFEAINGRGLIIDEVGKYIDKEEATKVYYEDGRVIDIGKNLKEYNAFDTGFFILDGSFLKFAEELEAEKEELKMSEIVKRANLECFPVSGYFWMDVDTKKDLKRAKRFLIKKSVKSAGDGWISRLINRKISTKLTELLVDKLSPNQATLLSFFLGLLSSFTLFFSIPLGALLYQISSIIDGIDGEIARVKMAGTEFGGWLDSVLDRIVDFSFLSVLLLKLKPEGTLLITGLLAIFGTVMVSYVSERFRGAFRVPLHEAIPEIKYIIGKRDERIFLIFILALLGFIKELFIILAIITNLRVLLSSYFVFVKYGTENL